MKSSAQLPVHTYTVTPVVPVASAIDTEMVEVAEEALELITVPNGEGRGQYPMVRGGASTQW